MDTRMHTGLVLELPSAVNVLTGPAQCRILQKQTFILHYHRYGLSRRRKRRF